MASFDFIDASSHGYQFVWDKRGSIARIALIPFVVKLLCFLGVTAFTDDENFMRHGLLLLPSYFAEGWLAVVLVRVAVLGQPWPGSAEAKAQGPAVQNIILSATLIYVLIKLAAAFVAGYVLTSQGAGPVVAEPSEPSAVIFFAAIGVLVGMIWAFRLAWLYVPAALGYSVKGFIFRTRRYGFSAYLIGTWLLCFVPLALALIMISKFLNGVFPGDGESISTMFTYSVTAVQAVLEVIVACISSVAIAHGIKSIYDGTSRTDTIL